MAKMESSPMFNKRKRSVIMMEQKLEIFTKLDKGETSVFLARDYVISKSTVRYASKIDNSDGIKRRKVMKVVKIKILIKLWIHGFYKNKA